MRRDFYCSTVTEVHITLYKEVLNPCGMSHYPLCSWMIKNDFNTAPSCVLSHDLQTLSQRSYTPLCTSVRLTLFNCCHSCSKSSSCIVYHFTQTLFLITIHGNVFITRLQQLQKQFQIFEFYSFAMHDSRKRSAARSSTYQDVDLCTLLTVLDCCVVKL